MSGDDVIFAIERNVRLSEIDAFENLGNLIDRQEVRQGEIRLGDQLGKRC